MTFEELRSELDDLAGLDLEIDERDRLLNEGHRKLACESDWYQANINLGPTVVDQVAYTLPTDVYRILKLTVNGYPYAETDEETVSRHRINELYLRLNGVYWLSFSSANVEQVSLYPTPGTAGLAITAQVVERPALMTADANVPVVPEEFHRAIVDWAASIAFGAAEDAPDLRTFYKQQFDEAVAKLRTLRMSRGGRGVRQARVVGIHV